VIQTHGTPAGRRWRRRTSLEAMEERANTRMFKREGEVFRTWATRAEVGFSRVRGMKWRVRERVGPRTELLDATRKEWCRGGFAQAAGLRRRSLSALSSGRGSNAGLAVGGFPERTMRSAKKS